MTACIICGYVFQGPPHDTRIYVEEESVDLLGDVTHTVVGPYCERCAPPEAVKT